MSYVGRPRLDDVARTAGGDATRRASAVFPVRLRDDSDVWLSFLNYWQLKNANDDVRYTAVVRDAEGVVVAHHSAAVDQDHTDLSLRALVGDGAFDGRVDIDFTSAQDLRFRYPGIQAVYRTGALWSAVHTAGRVRHEDELVQHGATALALGPFVRRERAWSPAVFIFQPERAPRSSMRCRVIDGSGATVVERDVPLDPKPLGSCLVLVDEALGFSSETLPRDAALQFELDAEGCFPRTVAGHVRRHDGALEVDHTGEMLHEPDTSAVPPEQARQTWFARPPGLDVEVVWRCYNTYACEAALCARTLDGTGTPLSAPERLVAGGPDARVVRWQLPVGADRVAWELSGPRVPGRVKVESHYRVAGTKDSTVAALSAGTHDAALAHKRRSWGPVFVRDGLRTLLLVRTFAAPGSERRARLRVFDAGGLRLDTQLVLRARTVEVLDLAEMGVVAAAGPTASFFLEADGPAVEVDWVALGEDGRVFGHHAF